MVGGAGWLSRSSFYCATLVCLIDRLLFFSNINSQIRWSNFCTFPIFLIMLTPRKKDTV